MRIGIDLGGTKIECLALNASGAEIFRRRVDTPKGDYIGTCAAIVALVKAAEHVMQQTVQSIGVGIPGAISKRTGLVKNANSTWLIGENLQGDLQQHFKAKVTLANDANCFALSEASDGAAAGADVVFGVIIGTGCGGGVIVQGQVLNGVNAIGGEWGHNPLPWQTLEDIAMPCYCGLNGCNETFLSGSGFQTHYQHKTGQALKSQQIVDLAKQGDAKALAHLEEYCVWLAKGLASVINVLDPDVIVLGGGMSNIDYLYERVPQLWSQWVFSDAVETQLRPPKWGDSSGVRGAAWL